MEYPIIFPHAKVFTDTDGNLHFITYTYKNKSGHKQYKRMGDGLIDFITLNLGEFENKMKKAFSKMKTAAYEDMREQIFDIVELLKGKHTYVAFFLVGAINNIFADEKNKDTHIQNCFSEFYTVLALHEIFKSGVSNCLDVDVLPEYTMMEKYRLFTFMNRTYGVFPLKTTFEIVPSYNGKMDFSVVENINRKNITGDQELLKAIQRDSKGVNLVSCTIIETLEQMLYFEFIELLKQGSNVKKCKLCGQYFILPNQHETYFCDRIHSEKRTCKQVGTRKDYSEKVANDPILQEYQRIYKRYYSRGKMPFEKNPNGKFYGMSLKDWSALATKLRTRYNRGEIIGEELIVEISET
jgi:hypothetical protein